MHAPVQVATEWLFSVPDHILHKHLASDPNTPVAEVASPEDHRVFTPRRVRLQVLSLSCRGELLAMLSYATSPLLGIY